MKNKKFISMVLALAMVFTMSVSVFASGTTTTTTTKDPNTFEATATVNIPDIDVTVPDEAPLFINPLGFKIVVTGTNKGKAATSDDTDVSESKIVSPIFPIKNASPMKLDVNVIGYVGTVNKAAGAASDATAVMSIATAPILDTDTKNSVFIYAQFAAASVDSDNVCTFSSTPAATYTTPAETAVTFPQLALTTKVPTKPVNVGTIAKTADPDAPTVLGFQFRGDCNAKATKDWAAGESVTVTLIFSFKPSADQS